jgi:NAD(P)-dependent dehydrogenase (short-subunit alcohol dehydrogenase family)
MLERASAAQAENGPVAVVTGAAGGIGRSICRTLAGRGCSIVAWDRDHAGLQLAERELVDERRVVFARSFDLTDAAECREAAGWVHESLGRVDILVNNAASWFEENLEATTDEHWRHVLEVNVVAPARLAKLLLPALRRSSQARIVNIASKNAFAGEYGLVSYSVSKAALVALTREQALEYATYGVLVNCVAPGVIDTDSNEGVLAGDAREVFRSRIPIGRFGSTDEVAHAVAFLRDRETTFCSGSTLLVDGGQLAGQRP